MDIFPRKPVLDRIIVREIPIAEYYEQPEGVDIDLDNKHIKERSDRGVVVAIGDCVPLGNVTLPMPVVVDDVVFFDEFALTDPVYLNPSHKHRHDLPKYFQIRVADLKGIDAENRAKIVDEFNAKKKPEPVQANVRRWPMRECPQWFQAELTRIGGVNQYDEPIFKLVWSSAEQLTVGGRWPSGFEGYKKAPLIPGEPCWALMVWEPAEVAGGSFERWDRDFRDDETGLLEIGGYPKYGAYRLLQKFIHREIVQQAKERHFWVDGKVRTEVIATRKMRTYCMEPNGFMLDVMLPMLMAWKRLTNAQKVAALKQQEQMRKDEYLKTVKDARDGMKLSRVMRGSQLVQKRAEIIERGMRQAMAAAAQWGLGMAITQ